MKNSILIALLCIISINVLAQKSTTKSSSKSYPKKTTVTKTHVTTKKVSAKNSPKPSAKNQQNTTPNSNNSVKKGCANCVGFEGITLSTNTNGKFSFDSIAKTYLTTINPENIGGTWRYLYTILIDKQGNLIKKLRAYYNDLDQQINTNPTIKNQSIEATDLISIEDDPAEKMRIENERLGRNKFDPNEILIVYDPNVDYLFLDKPGTTEDNYVIRKKKPDQSIMQLTTADIRFSFSTLNNNQTQFALRENQTPFEKKFIVLALTPDSFIIADFSFKEIHVFDRSGIHNND